MFSRQKEPGRQARSSYHSEAGVEGLPRPGLVLVLNNARGASTTRDGASDSSFYLSQVGIDLQSPTSQFDC